MERLKELLGARIPAKWWWCNFTVTVKNYNLSGRKVEEGLFEAIQTTIEIAGKAKEEKSTTRKIQLYNILYSNINEILEKVNQLQYMEKIMQKLEDAKKGADKSQIKELANLQLELADEFQRNNGIITATENEIDKKIAQIIPQPTETQEMKARNSIPAVEEAKAPLDTEIAKLAEEVKKIDYHNIPILQGIQKEINETLKKVDYKHTRKLAEEEREEIVSQLKFWADGKTYFAQLANITLEALESGYAPINDIPIEYVRTFIEYQDQIPLKLDLTNQMIIVAPEKIKQTKN
ncbi:MAG: hypothetical protein KIH08_07450 [Candidatus Freyarchaeota archaeon]|nr:hypothetical protein [Candidatus Jordarchaeia archaeon]